jgi:hypothetical protein
LSQEEVHIIEKEFSKFKIKLQEILNEFSKKKKEILELYDGAPDVSLLLRKEDWFLVKISMKFAIHELRLIIRRT